MWNAILCDLAKSEIGGMRKKESESQKFWKTLLNEKKVFVVHYDANLIYITFVKFTATNSTNVSLLSPPFLKRKISNILPSLNSYRYKFYKRIIPFLLKKKNLETKKIIIVQIENKTCTFPPSPNIIGQTIAYRWIIRYSRSRRYNRTIRAGRTPLIRKPRDKQQSKGWTIV